jgi:predicted P-loop ATPase/GTPase
VSYAGPEGRLRTLPVEWTDVIEPDLVVTVGAGRAFFRTDQLRELRKLIDECWRQQEEAPSC